MILNTEVKMLLDNYFVCKHDKSELNKAEVKSFLSI